MRSAIRELYNGETFPADRRQEMSKEYVKVLEYQERHENDLLATLTEAQKETFEKYKDCASEIGLEDDFRAFSAGVCLGIRLMAEATIGHY